jgi:hypothetical protein
VVRGQVKREALVQAYQTMQTIRGRWREYRHPNPVPESVPAALTGLDGDLAVPDHPSFEHLADHVARPLYGVGRALATGRPGLIAAPSTDAQVHEALTVAAAEALPLTFLVWWLPQLREPGLWASGYGARTIEVNGNDVAALRETLEHAVGSAPDAGPAAVLASVFYVDPDACTQAELNRWLAEDPMAVARAALLAAGVTPDELDRLGGSA